MSEADNQQAQPAMPTPEEQGLAAAAGPKPSTGNEAMPATPAPAAVQPSDTGFAAAAAQPVKPQVPLHSKIAEGIIHAFAGTNGTAGDALRSALAGGLAGLAAASRTPVKPGAPFGGFGIGAEAAVQQREQQAQQIRANQQQDTENQRKERELRIQEQREQREETTGNREYDLRLREDARQQAESIRKGSEFEKRSKLLDQAIAEGDYTALKQHAADLQTYADQWNDLQTHGGKRLVVNGAESPEFEHLGDAENFVVNNFDASMHPDMKTRLMRNPESGKWAIMETPYEAPKWHSVKDAAGKDQKIFTDTMGALAAQEQVAKTKHYLNVAARSSLELKEALEGYKEEGTVKGARKELTRVGGDYSKLSPGSREAILGDASKRFNMAQTGLEKELMKPEDLQDKASVDFLKEQRDMYAKEFAELSHPTWEPKGGQTGEQKTTTIKATTSTNGPAQTPPETPQHPPDYILQNGPKGYGWYPPAPAETPEINIPEA